MTLLQYLIKQGIIKKEKADSLNLTIKQSGKKEEEIILKSKLISEENLFNLKSQFLKIPIKEVIIEEVLLSTLESIPEETAKYYQMVPLSRKGNFLEIGMPYPEDLKAQEALKFLAQQNKFNYKIFLITFTTFNELLKQYRTLKREVTIALEQLEKGLEAEEAKIRPKSVAEFERMAEEAPITKIVAVILKHAVEGLASDVHIEPTQKELRIRFRLLGNLYSSILLPLKVHLAVVARIKIISNLKIDESRIPQDGRFSVVINERLIDFRVSTFPTVLGEKVAIRVLDPEAKLKTFEELGLGGRNLEIIKEKIIKPHGLILTTGPTGCGKTTTLYTLLQLLNKEEVNIVTLEDPIEYLIEGVNQSQIRPEIGYDFPVGLRYTLRQDPDIMMVGEVRDETTASLVIHAALTGHIVLSTIHTINAVGAIPRLIDLGIKPYLISPSLSLIIAQRLVRRLCDNCKKEIKPSSKIKEILLKGIAFFPEYIKKDLKIREPLTVFVPQGCPKCEQIGFSSRIGVFEILSMTKELSEIILKEPSEAKIIEEFERQKMITMYQDGILKVLAGITTIEEVLMVAEEYVQ
jgi:type IV pilus assembly protein PilB